MSYGELCDKKIKIYKKLPTGSVFPYKKCESIVVNCRHYKDHEGKHIGTVVDVNGDWVGDIEFSLPSYKLNKEKK